MPSQWCYYSTLPDATWVHSANREWHLGVGPRGKDCSVSGVVTDTLGGGSCGALEQACNLNK